MVNYMIIICSKIENDHFDLDHYDLDHYDHYLF